MYSPRREGLSKRTQPQRAATDPVSPRIVLSAGSGDLAASPGPPPPLLLERGGADPGARRSGRLSEEREEKPGSR